MKLLLLTIMFSLVGFRTFAQGAEVSPVRLLEKLERYNVTFVDRVDTERIQRCDVGFSKGAHRITYQNIGPQIATFKGSVMRILPKSQRAQIQSTGSGTTVRFANTPLYSTQGNAYSTCVSLVMAEGIFMTKSEADLLLVKSSRNSWIDLCVQNQDGMIGVCHRETEQGVGPQEPCETSAISNFTLVHRFVNADQTVSIDSSQTVKVGLIENAGSLNFEDSDLNVSISCTERLIQK